MEKQSTAIIMLPHAPYSPDLVPSDYFFFPNLKKWLGGQRFSNNEEVESARRKKFRIIYWKSGKFYLISKYLYGQLAS